MWWLKAAATHDFFTSPDRSDERSESNKMAYEMIIRKLRCKWCGSRKNLHLIKAGADVWDDDNSLSIILCDSCLIDGRTCMYFQEPDSYYFDNDNEEEEEYKE